MSAASVLPTAAAASSAAPPSVLLAHHLKELRLPTCLREYERLAQQCAQEGVDHVRYLLRLVEYELLDRERRLIERRIKAARCIRRRNIRPLNRTPWPAVAEQNQASAFL
jgi:hypothetical protein